ncbi:putative aspartate kinase [Rosa chinensis]|uniref:Putative aspartate kinase n=1 Tax=Rosa chinensis TaxID=74649 RepID=A0A2P6QDI8_ROSCH|nr:putative aspartate kinase [Rosa chinensis]
MTLMGERLDTDLLTLKTFFDKKIQQLQLHTILLLREKESSKQVEENYSSLNQTKKPRDLGIWVDVFATSEVSICLRLDPSKLWSR